MRLQARLGQLAALDAYIVNEVETIRSKMQRTIQSLKDVEINRMQVDLQVDIPSCVRCTYICLVYNELSLFVSF